MSSRTPASWHADSTDGSVDEFLELPDALKTVEIETVKDRLAGAERVQHATTFAQMKFRSLFQQMVWIICHSKIFNVFIFIVILTNIIVISVSTDISLRKTYRYEFDMADLVFLAIYTVEFLMKLYSEGRLFWASGFNVFDFVILVTSFGQIALDYTDLVTGTSSLSWLRALRSLRALRTVSFVRSLRVLVTALLRTVVGVLSLFFLIVLFNYVFAIVGFYIFEKSDPAHFGSLGKAFTALFTYVTVDGWTELVYASDTSSSRWFAVAFIFLSHFILANLFIGVVIQNLDEATLEEQALQFLQRASVVNRKKSNLVAHQRQEHAELLNTLRARRDGEGLREVLRQIESHLTSAERTVVHHLSCNTQWMQTYVATLGFHETTLYRTEMLHFEAAGVLCELFELSRNQRTQKW